MGFNSSSSWADALESTNGVGADFSEVSSRSKFGSGLGRFTPLIRSVSIGCSEGSSLSTCDEPSGLHGQPHESCTWGTGYVSSYFADLLGPPVVRRVLSSSVTLEVPQDPPCS